MPPQINWKFISFNLLGYIGCKGYSLVQNCTVRFYEICHWAFCTFLIPEWESSYMQFFNSYHTRYLFLKIFMLLNIYTRGHYFKCNVIEAFIYNFINPNFGGHFRGSFDGVGGLSLSWVTHSFECQKPYIWYINTHIQVLLENILLNTPNFLLLLMSAFFAKNQHFLAKKIVPKAIVRQFCQRFFNYIFSFREIKGYY